MKQKMFPTEDAKLPMVHDLEEEACPSDHSPVQEQAPTQAQLQGIANYVTYSGVSPNYQAYLATFFSIVKPSSFAEANQVPSQYDHSLFVKKLPECTVIVLVYIDDMLITGTSLQLIEETKRKYTLELISELGLGAAKLATTPLEMNARLTTKEYDDHLKTQESAKDKLLPDSGAYQRLIGKLLCRMVIRPGLAFSVQTLSQFLQQSKKSHIEATTRIVRYVKTHPGQGVLLSSNNKVTLEAYCDADWTTCQHSRKFVRGFLINLGDFLVSWKSKKQATVSRSSIEAEYRSFAATIAELVWLTGLIMESGFEVQLPIDIYYVLARKQCK
ncbi:uncharacterized mitochondrial protein AtMg00810-like [Nicotiana tomentosiformis]|uniref:uncharacterized mitochondrial protein AtMg00810-like n=1 Tax=Nicotiana tomentosiformis TaxID=4098 RepID=UPI00388C3718